MEVEDLRGVWVIETPLPEHGWTGRQEYRFSEGDILEVLTITLDIDTRDVLGYRYRSLRRYHLEGDQLTLRTLSTFINDDTQRDYTDLESLELWKEDEGAESTVTCRVEDDGRKLVFVYPPCGPLGNCIGSRSFTRED